MKFTTLSIAVAALVISVAQGFSTSSKSSSMADEAVSIFQAAYPKKDTYKPVPWTSWGVPARDFDGTEIKKSSMQSGRRMADIDEQKCRTTFNALSKVYGQEQALEMTRIMPFILTFDSKCFAPSFQEWSDIFGSQETKEMVLRNPGLLALPPDEAATATDQTMNFSYAVAVTRPLSGILLPGLLFLLAVPTIEAVTGISIRGGLSGLFN